MSESFDRDFLVVLHDVARMMRTRFDQRARVHGMTRAQWVILARLARQPGLSQAELAALVEVEPITVARLVDRLEASGYVERRPDPKDRRVWRVHLTPAAEPVLADIRVERDALYAEFTADIDPVVLDTMIDGLLAMKANLTQNGRSVDKAV